MNGAGTPRVVVLASGRGSNFAALAEAVDAGECRAELVALISDRRKAEALERAHARGMPTAIVPKAKGEDRDAWSERLLEAVRAHEPDLVVLAGFMKVLGASFVDAFARRIVNVHPSLLPAFPGLDAPGQAIAAGVRVSGCTVHLVDRHVDTGPILAQAVVAVAPGDDGATLHERIQRLEHVLLPRVVNAIGRGALVLDPAPRWEREGERAALLEAP
ncbi:MAG: phosphoribosylglycinamide formyltransferase [Deltaproteobacteria bacterium]|nr:phosphoribosylglycinamide formyltransferase [Deltaproteobacteria bacterium]